MYPSLSLVPYLVLKCADHLGLLRPKGLVDHETISFSISTFDSIVTLVTFVSPLVTNRGRGRVSILVHSTEDSHVALLLNARV